MLLWRLAWRNVWRNGRRAAVVITAVAVGIAGVVLSMAINYGMVIQMVENAISNELGHIQVHAPGFIDNPELARHLTDGARRGEALLDALTEVESWAPRVRAQGLLFSARASAGVRLVAIDPLREAEVSRLSASMVEGAYLDGDRRRVLIGANLARRLHVGVGSKVVLSVQDLAGDLTGEAFRVGGLFQTASSEIDRGTIYVRIDEAQKLLALGDGISELVVVAKDDRHLPALQAELQSRLGDSVEVQTWEELQPFLVYIVDMMDQMAWWTYLGVFIAMAFGIANVLLMAVYERTREIGVVRSIGMSGRRVVLMVLLESMLLTLLGLFLGFAGALAGVWTLRDGIDLSSFAEGLSFMGIGTRIVPRVRSFDLMVPTVVAILTALLSSLWPAIRAARVKPAEALRHV